METENKRVKRVLIVVDMVKGFRTVGNMAIKDIKHIDDEVVRLVELFLKNNDDVIFVGEGHTENSVEFTNFLVHCLMDTMEAEFIDVLKPYLDRVKCIRKNSTSGFVVEEFQEYLKNNKHTLIEVVFCGVCSDLCVMNIAIPTKMYFNEHNKTCDVIVPENGVETYDAPGHSREEYNNIAKKILRLNGIKVPERYER